MLPEKLRPLYNHPAGNGPRMAAAEPCPASASEIDLQRPADHSAARGLQPPQPQPAPARDSVSFPPSPLSAGPQPPSLASLGDPWCAPRLGSPRPGRGLWARSFPVSAVTKGPGPPGNAPSPLLASPGAGLSPRASRAAGPTRRRAWREGHSAFRSRGRGGRLSSSHGPRVLKSLLLDAVPERALRGPVCVDRPGFPSAPPLTCGRDLGRSRRSLGVCRRGFRRDFNITCVFPSS